MAAISLGPIEWGMTEDEIGYRTYKYKSLVRCTSTSDGPLTAMLASGLPLIGSYWAFGNDLDPWSFCRPNATVQPVVTKEPNRFFTVEQTFSNKPLKRCQDFPINNPLAEPPKLSGSFTRYLKTVQKDMNGKAILNSSYEPLVGIQKDANRPSVVIEFNTPTLGLDIFSPMVTTVNDSPLWGLPKRTIMLSNVSWTRNLYGSCTFYYTIRLEFEVRYETFDISDALDKGFKKFRGEPGDSRTNPTHYIVNKDSHGENHPIAIALNGNGDPLTDPSNPVFVPTIKLATESNFFSLGIPSSL